MGFRRGLARWWSSGQYEVLGGDWLNGRALPWGGRDSGFDSRVPDVFEKHIGAYFSFPDWPDLRGIAQLAERLVRDQEVLSSSLSAPIFR